MKVSYISAASLLMVLTAAALDAGQNAITYRWLPILTLAFAVWTFSFSATSRSAARCLLKPSLLWIALMALYVLNPTHYWETGVGLWPADPWPWLPGSADARHGLDAVALSAMALAVAVLASRVGPDQLKLLQWWAVIGAGMMAAVVLHQRLIPRPHPIYELTGTFPYENHYAAFANLVLPVVLLAATRFRFNAFQRGAASSPAGVCYLAALLIAISILMSGSRAGVVWMVFSLAGWLGVLWRLQRVYEFVSPSRTRLLPYLRTTLMVIALGSLIMAVRWIMTFSINWGREARFRFQILADTVAIWRDNPWWGTGPGTFVSVFPYYQSETLARHQLAHAHCEPLQFLAELGVFGVLVALGVAAWWWYCARCQPVRKSDQWPTFNEIEGPGFVLALSTLAAHSLVDFPLRMPAIVLVASAWWGLLAAHGEWAGFKKENRDEG